MAYVKRNAKNEIVGFARWPTSGFIEIDDQDPEILAFLQPKPESERVVERASDDPLIRRLIAVIADEVGKTPQELIQAMRAKS